MKPAAGTADGVSSVVAVSSRRAPWSNDLLAILLVWLATSGLTLFVEPNYDLTPASQLIYTTTYNAGVGAFVGFGLFGRWGRARPGRLAAMAVTVILTGALLNEAVVEPHVFRTGPLNWEGLYFSVVEAATTSALFVALRLIRQPLRHWPPATVEDSFFVRVAGATRRIRARDVLYMQAERDFTRVVCADGAWFVSESLKGLLEKCAPFGFVRAHKSFVVNTGRIQRMSRTQAELGEHSIPVGRKYATALAAAWKRGDGRAHVADESYGVRGSPEIAS